MRTLKELLIILRDNVDLRVNPITNEKQIVSGLCKEAIRLENKGLINSPEYDSIDAFISNILAKRYSRNPNDPYYPYLFRRCDWTSRKRWLNRQIKLLNEQDKTNN